MVYPDQSVTGYLISLARNSHQELSVEASSAQLIYYEWYEAKSRQNEASRMTMLGGPEQVPLAQSVLAPLTRAAIFLVVTMRPEAQSYAAVRTFCGDLAGLIRAVEFRDIDAGLSCIAAFGSDAWDRL